MHTDSCGKRPWCLAECGFQGVVQEQSVWYSHSRQQATTQWEDHFVAYWACQNWITSAQTLRSDLLNATGTNFCIQTIRNRLHNVKFCTTPEDPAFVFHSLSDGNDWPGLKIMWTGLQLTGPLCCSLMSRGFVRTTLMVVLSRVWRRPGERYQDDCIIQLDCYSTGSLMVWGGISMAAWTDLLILHQGCMTAQRYWDEVVDVHVRPYTAAIGDYFILMDDNAPPHLARII